MPTKPPKQKKDAARRVDPRAAGYAVSFKEQAWAADWAPQKVVARPTVRKAALQKQSNLARESLAAVSRLR
jgi:hypothetical protein